MQPLSHRGAPAVFSIRRRQSQATCGILDTATTAGQLPLHREAVRKRAGKQKYIAKNNLARPGIRSRAGVECTWRIFIILCHWSAVRRGTGVYQGIHREYWLSGQACL